MRLLPVRSVTAAAILFVAGSCTSVEPTAPAADDLSNLNVATLATRGLAVDGLLRTTALEAPITTSAVVGPGGGSLAIPAAGLTLTIPPGALRSPTTITITAPAGRAVAYEFGPHGTRFAAPVVVTQDLALADLSELVPSTFFAGYFRNISDVDPETAQATVTEVIERIVFPSPMVLAFEVSHFSGYMVATGRSRAAEQEGQ